MRSITFALVALSSWTACSGKKEPDKTEQKPPVESAPITPKKVIDQKPLPPLAADPGGATGKAAWSAAFGGIATDAPKGIAVGTDGAAYVIGYFEGDTDFGGTDGKHSLAGNTTHV